MSSLTGIRAYVASAHEAFSSPTGFLWFAYENGDNMLSEDEVRLAETLDKKGGRDLGDCVRGSRLTQYLREVVATSAPHDGFIYGLHEAMGYGRVLPVDRDRVALAKSLKVKFGIEDGLLSQEIYHRLCASR